MFTPIYYLKSISTDNPCIPGRIGTINDLDKLDHVFFGIYSKFANFMQPMTRMMLERVYEAIIDAGINPSSLKGSRTAVFTATSFSEGDTILFYSKVEVS